MSCWPHPDPCRCCDCIAVGVETRREQRAEAKRRVAEILAMRPRRAPFGEPAPGE